LHILPKRFVKNKADFLSSTWNVKSFATKHLQKIVKVAGSKIRNKTVIHTILVFDQRGPPDRSFAVAKINSPQSE
jgi:hypothetical protein